MVDAAGTKWKLLSFFICPGCTVAQCLRANSLSLSLSSRKSPFNFSEDFCWADSWSHSWPPAECRLLVVQPVVVSCRDEWAEAIQMVAESLAKQEEEGILCSPTSQIENVNEEEMDTSISHYKRKVTSSQNVKQQLWLVGWWRPGLLTSCLLSLRPDNEWLWLSEASGQRHLRESHSGEGEGEWHLLRHEDPEEGGHHSQGLLMFTCFTCCCVFMFSKTPLSSFQKLIFWYL